VKSWFGSNEEPMFLPVGESIIPIGAIILLVPIGILAMNLIQKHNLVVCIPLGIIAGLLGFLVLCMIRSERQWRMYRKNHPEGKL